MKNRNIKFKMKFIASILIIWLTIGACESYLDKAPEASITDKDVFGNFISFQGFVEEMYNCIVDYQKTDAVQQCLVADEVLYNSPIQFDLGNYWSQASWLYGTTVITDDASGRTKTVWPLAWYAIRKANLGLSKLDLLVDATKEEKDLIKGQCLFFRGWFYFELMRYWGGLPYIDKVLSSTEELKMPRLNYRETALKAAEDFKAAAVLLPLNWDNTEAGKATLGNNKQRISKLYALGYLGKDLLFAASPMMNEESTGKALYDAELCKQAAAVFAEVINICNTTGAYKLQSWDTWTDNFWVWSPSNNTMSGGTEVIMNPTVFAKGNAKRPSGAFSLPHMGGNFSRVTVPTHSYLKNYGMANGYPLDDPLSNFNPNTPWVGREPRFYKDIILDGDEIVASSAAGLDQFAQLYNNGRHRQSSNGSVTGYLFKKWSPKGCNNWENKWNNFQSYCPFLRLADIYLMYAEAVLQGYGTPSSSVPGNITAEAAVNIIRNRAQLINVPPSYTATKEKFMEVIIRERAVELAFEDARWMDLRRWNLAGAAKYKDKTALDYDRGPNGKPINIKERVVVTRVFDKKHNWVPFQVSFTKLYEDFPQNPGW